MTSVYTAKIVVQETPLNRDCQGTCQSVVRRHGIQVGEIVQPETLVHAWLDDGDMFILECKFSVDMRAYLEEDRYIQLIRDLRQASKTKPDGTELTEEIKMRLQEYLLHDDIWPENSYLYVQQSTGYVPLRVEPMGLGNKVRVWYQEGTDLEFYFEMGYDMAAGRGVEASIVVDRRKALEGFLVVE